MSVDKLVDSTQLDSDLTDVADEIRTAGGTLLPLSFPDDYVVAIGDIGNTEIKTASGSIAHFEDALARKAQALTVAVEPVQDLHGYDNPWPAGGGKNLLTALPSPGITVWFCEPNGFTFKANQTYCFSIGNNITVGSYSIYAEDKTTQLAYASSSRKVTYTPTVDTVGYPRLYAGGGVSQEAINSAQLELGNSRTTYAPYSNICPISGWTGANVTRTGKNLLQPGLSPSATGSSTATPTASGGYVLRATASSGWLWNRINVLPAKPFAGKRLIFGFDISIDHDQNPQTIFALRNSDGVVSSKTVNYSASRLSAYLDIPANVTDDHVISMTLYVTTSVSASVGWETTYSNLQIEIVGASETAPTAYEAYNADTYSITFPTEAGTVYGGTLDVTTGKLMVDRAIFASSSDDLNGLIESTSSTNDWLVVTKSRAFPNTDGGKRAASICSHAPYKFANVDGTTHFYVTTNGFWLAVPKSVYPTFADFTNSLTGNNVLRCVAYIATPIVYDLTPTEVTTLLGTNNVWSDTGDSTIKYIAPKAQIPSAQGVYF